MDDAVSKYMAKIGRKRFEGKTPEEISKIMKEVRRKGIEKKKKNEVR